MNFRDPRIMVAMIAGGIAVISLCLVWATYIMLFPACIGLIISSGIAVSIEGKKYINYKNKMQELWYQDAFAYADEIGDPKAVYAFKYPKDVDRKLKAKKFNMWLKMVAPLTVLVLAIVLLLAGMGMVISG